MALLQLASASPRRATLLEQIGVPYQRLTPPDIDERVRADERPDDYVRRMAREKARVGRQRAGDDAGVVLAADTAVVLGDVPLGKPADDTEAAAMLRRLSGEQHRVLSAVGLYGPGQYRDTLVETRVLFLELSDELINAYVATGEPRDKAGAYGIQGLGAVLVAALEGSYTNVVGLPLTELRPLLDWAGVPYWRLAVP
jgi:septum formation protein